MNNIRHIHEVIFLIENYRDTLTPAELLDHISNTWGADVHFEACAGEPFPKESALDFLLKRQKVLVTENGTVILHPSMQICNGHEVS